MTIQKNTISNEIATCTDKLQNQEISKRIVIAKFDNADVNSRTEEIIFRKIKKDFVNSNSKIQVCLVNKIVTNSEEADNLGKDENVNADIVIWGNTTSSQNIYLEGVHEPINHLNELNFDLDKASTPNVQNQDLPQLISVMVAHGLSIIYYLNEQIPEARKIFKEALEVADSKIGKANDYNAKKFADAYFLLGTMFEYPDDSQCKTHIENCRQALKYYGTSLTYSRKLYRSFLNKAMLHEKLDEIDQAEETYSQLITEAPESDSAVIGRFYRSVIYLNQNKNDEALKDLEIVSQREPENTEYLYVLGLAQLKVGKIDEAKKTYDYVKKYISNPQLKVEVLSNLNSVLEETEKPEVMKATREIISNLQ